MSKIRSFGNKTTEARLSYLLRRSGVSGWRRQWPSFGKPDFAFPKAKLAVFVDGCFWHKCPKCYRAPKTSVAYWNQKITRNRSRDRLVNQELKIAGWRVLRIWECQLKRHPANCIKRIKRAILS
jgi:DNA mismatch endonuclease (patch repair protein)